MNEKTVESLKECISILGKLLEDEETKDEGMMCLKYFDSMIIAMENFGTISQILNFAILCEHKPPPLTFPPPPPSTPPPHPTP